MATAARVAVIGGGYSGMAAAITLADRGIPVTVFEAAKLLGGRARRVEQRQATLDNGLHILIGAYTETLRLMRRVGADPERLLMRRPFAWHIPGVLAFEAARLPTPLHMIAGLATARGFSLADRRDATRMFIAMRRADFRLAGDTSVASLLQRYGQGAAIVRLLWAPLCVSALNTPPERASARVFLNVLRDSVAARRAASDLLLPRVDLSRLFPEPAASWLADRGGRIVTGSAVRSISPVAGGFVVRNDNDESAYSHVICAVAPHQLESVLEGMPGVNAAIRMVAQFRYEPICSVYLQYPGNTSLARPMIGFDGALPQWAFDRGKLAGQAGLIGAVISAQGTHRDLPSAELGVRVHRDLAARAGPLPEPEWIQVIAEKRATFACVPGLARPGNRTALARFFLAGDYTESDYPATIESAVRSGIGAARLALETA